jgi:type IV pilus assembly protein PilA
MCVPEWCISPGRYVRCILMKDRDLPSLGHITGKLSANGQCRAPYSAYPPGVPQEYVGHTVQGETLIMNKRQKGFSLIELLIVVAIILIIAAIAIPNLLRSRMAANEASAVGSVRTINTAAISYNSSYGNGFPTTLAEIGTTVGTAVSCNNAEYLDSVLTLATTAAAAKSGYFFTLGAGATPVANPPAACAVAGSVDGYTIAAQPAVTGTTGQRSFCSDATGVIRFDPTGAAPGVAAGLCPAAESPLQ